MVSLTENVTLNTLQNIKLNETTDTNSTPISLSNSVIARSTIILFFGLAAMAGNSLIIVCAIQYRKLRTTTNILIANLAVADFLSGCSWVTFSAMTLRDCAKIPVASLLSENTKVVISLFPFLGNNFAVLLIALERFICIHYALRYYSIVTSHRTGFTLVLPWILIGVMCFTFDVERLKNTIMPVVGALCTVGIVVFYSYIGYVACTKSKQLVPQPQPQVMDGRTAEALDNQKAQWKITKFLALVFGVYLGSLLLCTILIAFNADYSIYSCNSPSLSLFIGLPSLGFNNCVNPFLYVWKSEKFRECVKKRFGIK